MSDFVAQKDKSGHIVLLDPIPEVGDVHRDVLIELFDTYNKMVDVTNAAKLVVIHEEVADDSEFEDYVEALDQLIIAVKAL